MPTSPHTCLCSGRSQSQAQRITGHALRGEVWILEIEGEPTGIAVLEGNTEYLLIYSIAVKPDAQRKGYGRALLDFADKRAIELGLHEVRLYTNEKMERNLTLYRGHGFVQVGKRPHPSRPGQVLVDMVRKLPSRR